MTFCALNLTSEMYLGKRRSMLFKPTLEENDIFKEKLSSFINVYRKQLVSISNAPITWERLSTGYRIVDFQIDRTEEALELLMAHYFCSNGSCDAANLYIDSYTIHKYRQFVLDLISNFKSLCAIEEGTGEMVGVAIAKTTKCTDEENETTQTFTSRDAFNVLKYEETLLKEAKLNEIFQFDKYLCIHILCVKPKHYDKGLGTSLIRACLSKALEYRYPLCIGIFPEGPSRTIAKNFGFEILAEMPWVKVRTSKTNYRCSQPCHLETTFVTCMGLLLPIRHDESD